MQSLLVAPPISKNDEVAHLLVVFASGPQIAILKLCVKSGEEGPGEKRLIIPTLFMCNHGKEVGVSSLETLKYILLIVGVIKVGDCLSLTRQQQPHTQHNGLGLTFFVYYTMFSLNCNLAQGTSITLYYRFLYVLNCTT